MKNLAALLICFPSIAFAEVSDKMASIPALWLQGTVGAVILFALGRYSYVLAALGFLVCIFWLIGTYETFADPYIGPAIRYEQGVPYVFAAYGSSAMLFLGLGAGFVQRLRRKRHAT